MTRVLVVLIVLLGSYHNESEPIPPGLVVGLRSDAPAPVAMPGDPGVREMKAAGLRWSVHPDRAGEDPAAWRLPPGVVLALTHADAEGHEDVRVFGEDPLTGATGMPGFRRCDSAGFAWYESTGAGFDRWDSIERFPPGTVVGLKDARLQPARKLRWRGRTYDAASVEDEPPPGFRRVLAFDPDGPPSGSALCWFEKMQHPRGDRS